MSTLRNKLTVEVVKDTSTDVWEKAIPCFKRELTKRVEEGSNETLSDWLDKLKHVYLTQGSFGVMLLDNDEVVGCAMLHPALNLHHDDLCSIFGIVADEGYGGVLLRKVMQVSRSLGYRYLHVSHKVTLTNYRSNIIKL